jgi:hypothetical protein
MTDLACMTPEERRAWDEMAARVRNGGSRPCVDCPLAFHLAEKAAGRCSSRPTPNGGRLPNDGRGRLGWSQ